MFEELEQEERDEKESRNRLLRVSAIIVGVLVVIGAIAYVVWRPAPVASTKVSVPTPAANVGPPDATRDLKLVRLVMGKDPSGLRNMWSVTIHNESTVYTYSNFKYEVEFMGPDGRILYNTADTIPGSVGPGADETLPDYLGGMYNANASTYHFHLVGAEAHQ
ncbi:MAG: hypothetical protein WB819_10240 [Terriglobia bacterium]